MENSTPKKAFSIFAAIFCLSITLIIIITIILPIDGFFIQPPYSQDKYTLKLTISMFLTFLAFTPQPIALAAYYFAGGIGKSKFAHILFALMTLSFIALLLTMLGLIVAAFAFDPPNTEGFEKPPVFQNFIPLTVLFGFVHFTIFPIIFTIAALVAKAVKSWQRLVPLISFILVFILSPIFAIIIFAIGTVTGSDMIYYGFKDQTLTNWLTTGSVAWALTALLAFYKKSEKQIP